MYCPLPWIHLGIRNNGDLRVCCHANQGSDKGLLRKPDGSVYNTEFDNIDKARNSQKMKDIRKAFLNNEWHSECIRCTREELGGVTSRYTFEKEPWKKYVNEEKIQKYTEKDGTIDLEKFPLIYPDIRFGNKCNLACRVCAPTESTGWYKDHYQLFGPKYNESNNRVVTIIKKDNEYNINKDIYNSWYKSDNFWNQMYNSIPYIKQIYMVGGEPLIIDEHYNFLEKCINQGYAKDIVIEYNTNLFSIPNKAWDIWKEFKRIEFGVSIDGIEKQNDYMRYPSKWNIIVKNINKIIKTMDNYSLRTTITVSIYNILYLPELFNWILEQNFPPEVNSKKKPFGSIHPLHRSFEKNIKALPINIKNKIKEELENSTIFKTNEIAKKTINQYIEFMFKEDLSRYFQIFLEINKKLDKVRNEKFEEVFPELDKILKEQIEIY